MEVTATDAENRLGTMSGQGQATPVFEGQAVQSGLLARLRTRSIQHEIVDALDAVIGA